MATHFRILAWKPHGQRSLGSQKWDTTERLKLSFILWGFLSLWSHFPFWNTYVSGFLSHSLQEIRSGEESWAPACWVLEPLCSCPCGGPCHSSMNIKHVLFRETWGILFAGYFTIQEGRLLTLEQPLDTLHLSPNACFSGIFQPQ